MTKQVAYFDPKLKQLKASHWFKSRPSAIKRAIETYPPNGFYRIGSGHNVYIRSYTEGPKGKCDEVTVFVTREWNPHVTFSRVVFGIKLRELVPIPTPTFAVCTLCDLDQCHVCGKPRAEGSMFCKQDMDDALQFVKDNAAQR